MLREDVHHGTSMDLAQKLRQTIVDQAQINESRKKKKITWYYYIMALAVRS